VVRRSTKPNVFEAAVQAGKTTAAAAYYWFSELYNHAPYNYIDDCEVDDDSLPIQHGRFYTQDDFPDFDLFLIAANLVRRFSPDYMLLHPMGMDYVGERFGGESGEYRNHAIRQDMWLAIHLAEWAARGYTLLVTGDHGMNADRLHGGTTPSVRDVPLYLIRPGQTGLGLVEPPVSMLQIAPTICQLLGIPIPETMKAMTIPLEG
jgi:predicted AlkP superfamily pyrophosphatase or phosphodiesterase